MVVGLIGMAIRFVIAIIGLLFFWETYQVLGPIPLLISIVVALFALKLIGFLGIRIPITLWSVLICVLFGIPGLLVMMLLSITGIAFNQKHR